MRRLACDEPQLPNFAGASLINLLNMFSAELRRLCQERGSIAEICRGTGINRQQFNKYLAGRMLPSSINMRKICGFLEVSEAELLAGTGGHASASGDLPEKWAKNRRIFWAKSAEFVEPESGAARPMLNGYYECYLPFQGACHMLLRWLLVVSDCADRQVFTCRTFMAHPDRQRCGQARSRYRGIVLPGMHEILLVGIGDIHLQQPSVISVSLLQQDGHSCFPAIALTRRADGPLATIAVLHYRGRGFNAREALARTGVISVLDPGLDAVVAGMMSVAPEEGPDRMRPVGLHRLRAPAVPAR